MRACTGTLELAAPARLTSRPSHTRTNLLTSVSVSHRYTSFLRVVFPSYDVESLSKIDVDKARRASTAAKERAAASGKDLLGDGGNADTAQVLAAIAQLASKLDTMDGRLVKLEESVAAVKTTGDGWFNSGNKRLNA